MTDNYDQIIATLRATYDRNAEARDRRLIKGWKAEERDAFLALLKQEGKRRLLEVGAGPGHYGRFFQDNGLDVVCTDLSPEMVRLCREKGLNAHVMDVLHLDYPAGSFDAAWSLNCFLHLPSADLPRALAAVHAVLAPGGLFYLGLYGGHELEGVWPRDSLEPKRFFCFHTDEQIQQAAAQYFTILQFRRIELTDEAPEFHFQGLTLRKGVGRLER